MNSIIFGVDEKRDPNIWHTITVNGVFNELAGRSVDIVDMFRLGRFCDTKKAYFGEVALCLGLSYLTCCGEKIRGFRYVFVSGQTY